MVGIAVINSAVVCLWFLGIVGVVANRGDLIRSFLCMELSSVMVGLSLVLTDIMRGTTAGKLFSIIMLGLSAAETSVALSATVLFYRRHGVAVVGNFLRG